MMSKWEQRFFGVVFALLPAISFGLVTGAVMQSWGVGLVVFAVFFGFGLDVAFGKGVGCQRY